MAQRKRVLARRENLRIKPAKGKRWNKANDYSAGNRCPDCGEAIMNRSKRCKLCSRKHRKQKAVRGWREVLLGNTELPKMGDPVITSCEICDERERTPDTYWCLPCQAWIDEQYLERSLRVA